MSLTQLYLRVWSKLVMVSAPRLPADSDAQTAVEDLKPKMNKYGPDCLLYLLSFISVFADWESAKKRFTE